MNRVDETARLGRGVRLGPFCVIEEGAVLGDGVEVGSGTVIHRSTVVGPNTVIGPNAVLGRAPNPARTSTVGREDLPPLKVGRECIIGAGAVIYAGSSLGNHTMVADQAFVREKCRIGHDVIIGRAVCLENRVVVGDCSKIQSGAYITAHTILEERVFIAPMVTTTNDNFMGRTRKRFKSIKGPCIKRGARIGGAAILLPGVTIGEEAFIAAGSLVTRDVAGGRIYMGIPARPVRNVPAEEFLGMEE